MKQTSNKSLPNRMIIKRTCLILGLLQVFGNFAACQQIPVSISTLNQQKIRAEFGAPLNTEKGFTVTFTIDLKKFGGEKAILEIPDVLTVRLRQHDPTDRKGQNYPAFKMQDGSVPVLEATLVLHSSGHPNWKNMAIGIPLAMLRKPEGEHEVILSFTGVRWTLYINGELLDNDFPFGYPQWEPINSWKMDPVFVKKAAICFPAVTPGHKQAKSPKITNGIQYWTPPGHNSWVGDVVTCYYRGRYHIFYLYDRRHHQSKFGCGAHYFEHLSTTDFKTWTVHEAATPLEEQWECIGTGTPFVWDNRLCLSYGLHTTRVYPEDSTTLPVQWDFLKKNGVSGRFPMAVTPGFAAGSSYSVSSNGVSDFKKSGILFHPSQNPSVYTDPAGKLRMMANYGSKGIWESGSVDGGWRCISPDFPPGGDCTFYFRWGNFDYIIGGFTGLWSKPSYAPDSAYQDIVGQGLDFYDGSAVPSITGIAGGRYLMAAWIPVRGWGGCLVIHELVQFANGRIGSKWMKEIIPKTGKPEVVVPETAEATTLLTAGKSFMLSLEVHPAVAGKGRFGISFLPENGEQASCELQISLDDLRAQFGLGSSNNFAAKEKSLREGGTANAIENLIGVDKPFTVRIMVTGNEKIGGSLIDAEIAGQRTMITYRADLSVHKLFFHTEGLELKKVRIAPCCILTPGSTYSMVKY